MIERVRDGNQGIVIGQNQQQGFLFNEDPLGLEGLVGGGDQGLSFIPFEHT